MQSCSEEWTDKSGSCPMVRWGWRKAGWHVGDSILQHTNVMASLPLPQIQKSPAVGSVLCILVSRKPFYILTLLKISFFKRGFAWAVSEVSVILSTGTSPTMQQRDFRILRLLTVHCSWSASKPEITAAGWARKKRSGQNPGFSMVSRAKSPWNPTDSYSLSWQQLQTQLLSCEANASLNKTKKYTLHTVQEVH